MVRETPLLFSRAGRGHRQQKLVKRNTTWVHKIPNLGQSSVAACKFARHLILTKINKLLFWQTPPFPEKSISSCQRLLKDCKYSVYQLLAWEVMLLQQHWLDQAAELFEQIMWALAERRGCLAIPVWFTLTNELCGPKSRELYSDPHS